VTEHANDVEPITLDRAREALRQKMLNVETTEGNDTYLDGYASGLHVAIRLIDDVTLPVGARRVDGVCPACKQQELYANPDAALYCITPNCPDPKAAAALLDGRYSPPEPGEYDLRINLTKPYIIALPGNGAALIVTDDTTETNTGWTPITRRVMCARLAVITRMLSNEKGTT
jgi:hypothetical protein